MQARNSLNQSVEDLSSIFQTHLQSPWSTKNWVLVGAGIAAIGSVTVASMLWLILLQIPPVRPMEDGSDWTAVLVEEFEGNTLNRDLWSTCYWWGHGGCTNLGNNELQWYRNGNVTVSDGALHLEAREYSVDTPEGDFDYISGMVTSGRYNDEALDAFNLTYGYIEIRARAPRGQGLWPAIWLLPSDLKSTPEIDMMEILGHAPDVLEMHYHHRIADERLSFGHSAVVSDMSEDWSVFGLRWTPEALIWFLDNEEVWRFEDRRLIANEPMYLLINLAVGGDWPGNPDASTVFPARFDIDYVRVWKYNADE